MATNKKTRPNFGLEERKEFLFYSLLAESYTSLFLGAILGIKDIKNSRTLGNKSSSLSFSQKVDLFLDMDMLDKDDKAKMTKFMEIRNQFMHNLSASTYVDCLSFIEGASKYLEKNYVDKKMVYSSDEDKYKKASLALADDVINITIRLYEVAKNRFVQEEMAKFNSAGLKAALHSFGGLSKILTNELSKINCLKEEDVQALVKSIMKRYSKDFAAGWAHADGTVRGTTGDKK